MQRYLILLIAVFAAAFVVEYTAPARCMADEPPDSANLRKVIEAEKIPVDEDLHLKEEFSKTRYYGLIRNREELEELWSNQVSAKKPYASRLGFGLPEPPEVDFENNSVLWFADRGAGASFVDSILVAAYDLDRKLFVTVIVFHSDYVSDRLNLWTVPVTGYSAEFGVLHKYEDEETP